MLQPCLSYSRRRDCINLGLLHRLYRGGGEQQFYHWSPTYTKDTILAQESRLRQPKDPPPPFLRRALQAQDGAVMLLPGVCRVSFGHFLYSRACAVMQRGTVGNHILLHFSSQFVYCLQGGRGTSRREFFAVGYFVIQIREKWHNFQGAVRNKPVLKFSKIACRTVAFATRSALVDGVQSNCVDMKPLAVDSSLCCTVVHSRINTNLPGSNSNRPRLNSNTLGIYSNLQELMASHQEVTATTGNYSKPPDSKIAKFA